MTQQYQSECYTCHEQIYLSKPTADSKWIKTNLDGSAHVDPQYHGRQQQEQQKPSSKDSELQARTKAIEQAHEENMRASEELRRSVESLTLSLASLTDIFTRVDKSIIFLSETIRAYLQMNEKK